MRLRTSILLPIADLMKSVFSTPRAWFARLSAAVMYSLDRRVTSPSPLQRGIGLSIEEQVQEAGGYSRFGGDSPFDEGRLRKFFNNFIKATGSLRTFLLFCISIILQHGFSQTILQPGDLALVGLGANIGTTSHNCVGGPGSGRDAVSFICFKDIISGTTIDIAANG